MTDNDDEALRAVATDMRYAINTLRQLGWSAPGEIPAAFVQIPDTQDDRLERAAKAAYETCHRSATLKIPWEHRGMDVPIDDEYRSTKDFWREIVCAALLAGGYS